MINQTDWSKWQHRWTEMGRGGGENGSEEAGNGEEEEEEEEDKWTRHRRGSQRRWRRRNVVISWPHMSMVGQWRIWFFLSHWACVSSLRRPGLRTKLFALVGGGTHLSQTLWWMPLSLSETFNIDDTYLDKHSYLFTSTQCKRDIQLNRYSKLCGFAHIV